jgi:hypothetical protein
VGFVNRAKLGLAKIGGAAAMVEIGRQVWPMLRPAVERGRDNAAAWRTARAHAARVLDGSYLDVFVAGVKHWVVWSADEPVAAYPVIDGDLDEAVRTVDLERRRRPGNRRSARARPGSRSTPAVRGDHW